VYQDIVDALETGATDVDVCTYVGIGQTTFYEWIAIGDAVIAGGDHERMPERQDEQALFAEFAKAVSRARGSAKITAIGTLHAAMKPFTEISTSVKTYSETRLRKDIDKTTGQLVDVEYTYREKTTTRTRTRRQGDWRASVEYLRRRHKTEWGDNVDVTSGGQSVPILVTKMDMDEL